MTEGERKGRKVKTREWNLVEYRDSAGSCCTHSKGWILCSTLYSRGYDQEHNRSLEMEIGADKERRFFFSSCLYICVSICDGWDKVIDLEIAGWEWYLYIQYKGKRLWHASIESASS